MSVPRALKRLGTLHGLLGIVLLVAGIALGAAGQAVIAQSAGGVITGCIDLRNQRVLRIPRGSTCPTDQKQITWNQTGPQGPEGPQGPAGATTTTVVTAEQVAPPSTGGGKFVAASVACPNGTTVTGGGFSFSDKIFSSHPQGNGWSASGGNYDTRNSATLTVYAVCASP